MDFKQGLFSNQDRLIPEPSKRTGSFLQLLSLFTKETLKLCLNSNSLVKFTVLSIQHPGCDQHYQVIKKKVRAVLGVKAVPWGSSEYFCSSLYFLPSCSRLLRQRLPSIPALALLHDLLWRCSCAALTARGSTEGRTDAPS